MRTFFPFSEIKLAAQSNIIIIASSTSKNKEIADYQCDGVNDNVEIQAAIDEIAARSHKYGKIMFLEGSFYLGNTVQIKSNIHFEGQWGLGTQINLADSVNKNMFEFTENVVSPVAGFFCKGIFFSANGANNTAGSIFKTKVGTIALWDVHFEDCQFYSARDVQLDIGSPWGFRMIDCDIEDGYAGGIKISSDTKRNDPTILGTKIVGNDTFGLQLSAVDAAKVVGCYIATDGSGNGGVECVSGSIGNKFIGCSFYGGTNGAKVDGTSHGTQFIGCDFQGQSGDGVILASGVISCVISDNIFTLITGTEINDSGTNTIISSNYGDDTATLTDYSSNIQNAPNLQNGVCEGRLTLTAGSAVTIADVTGAGILYFSPYQGNRIGIFDGTRWTVRTFAETSLALTVASASIYDVFAYNSAGTLALELSASWTNDTTRNQVLTLQNGVLVKSGTTTRRWLGTIRGTGSNIVEDSTSRRFVYNYYNRIERELSVIESTDSWSYATEAWRSLNNSTANRVQFILGVQEDLCWFDNRACGSNSVGAGFGVGIGLDATTANSAKLFYGGGNAGIVPLMATFSSTIAAGYHFIQALEYGNTVGTTNFYGDAGLTMIQSGLIGKIKA